MGATAKVYRVSLEGNEYILELEGGDDSTTLNIPKTTNLYILSG